MIEARLSEDIEAGARIKPRFSTDIVTTDGGWEVRNSRWSYPLHQFEFNLSPGYVGETELEEFRDLFYAAGGAAESFKFKDRFDYAGTAEPIGTGNVSSQQFQLLKSYTRGAITRTRKITRPVNGTVLIYYNGVLQGGGYSVNYSTGIVTASPGNGVAVTASFEYDVPVRFADDEAEFVGLSGELEQPTSIVLLEVRE